MLHWIEVEDRRGLPTWLRYVGCAHWGLILTAEQPRWYVPRFIRFGQARSSAT
jgi:hypothetical protein